MALAAVDDERRALSSGSMRLLACSAIVLSCTCGLVACAPDLEPCAPPGDQVAASGEASGADGVVTVVVTASDTRISLGITPAEGTFEHTAHFDLAGADVDDLVGEVTATVGRVFSGEGDEYGYLRLTDERGVWFEGGGSPLLNGNAQGGARIDGPFALGDASGEGCRLGAVDGYDVAVHDVVATLDDATEPVVVDAAGLDGTWQGVDVRVVGVRASRGIFVESPDTADGFGPGEHERVEVVGYLYRRAP